MANPAWNATDAAAICAMSLVAAPIPKRSSNAPTARIRPPPNMKPRMRLLGRKSLSKNRSTESKPAATPAATARPPKSGISPRELTLRSFGRSITCSQRARCATSGVHNADTIIAVTSGSKITESDKISPSNIPNEQSAR